MKHEGDIDLLIASIAQRAPIDWAHVGAHSEGENGRRRISALHGIERIAAFSHARWQRFSTLLGQSRQLDALSLETWLRGLDGVDEADLRHVLTRSGTPPDGGQQDAARAASELEVGAGFQIGAYTLESLIGRGGMGEVWRARRSDGRYEGRAAVKLLHLPLVSRHGRGRFQREGQILARLQHPHIARLLDAGVSTGGQPYLVLEYVDGLAIDHHCETRGYNLRERIRLFLDVLDAVAHAQANLVLHRDLKPSNILVDKAGQVKLLDFGIAKLLDDDMADGVETEVTRNAGRAFTPEFAAPEQLLGAPVSTATDVYAAGVVLYRLLTGCHPIPVAIGSPVERMQAVLEHEPVRASAASTAPGPAVAASRDFAQFRRELRGDPDNILAKSLKKSPAERYPNAAAFADDLRRYLQQEPVKAHADTARYRVGKFVRRHRRPVTGVIAAALALGIVTAVALRERGEAHHQRDEAQAQAQRAEAFTNVVTSLLSQVGPGGHALTPEELLDRAVGEMVSRYRDDPAFLVDMLIRISGRYYDLQITAKELATLVEAERVARRANDPALIFDVQVNTVETELAAGHKEAARQRIEEARRLLPALRHQPDLDDYLRAEAKVARATDDMPAAIGHLERARAILESQGRTHGNVYPGILSELAACRHLDGDDRGAYETTRQIVELDRQHGRLESLPGIMARTTLAFGVYCLGEVQRARTMFEDAVPGIGQPGVEILPTITARYGEVLSRLDRDDKGVSLIADAMPRVVDGGNELIVNRTRLALVRALVRAGRTTEAEDQLATVSASMLADSVGYRRWLGEASRLRAESCLLDGDLADAAREADAALRRHRYPQTRHGEGLPAAVLTLARVQLAEGQAAQAAVTARDAVTLSEDSTLDPARSADVGEARLVLALAQWAAGDSSAAHESAERAVACLRVSLGDDHLLTRRAMDIAARRVGSRGPGGSAFGVRVPS